MLRSGSAKVVAVGHRVRDTWARNLDGSGPRPCGLEPCGHSSRLFSSAGPVDRSRERRPRPVALLRLAGRDRRRRRHLAEHRQDASAQHLRQARRALPRGGGRQGPRAGSPRLRPEPPPMDGHDVTRPAVVGVPRQREPGSSADRPDLEARSSLVLPVNPSSVRVGRRIVAAWLDVLRERYDVNTVLLLVTELLVNAVARAEGPFRLSMWAQDGRLHIETRDESTAALALGPLTTAEADEENRRLRRV